MGFLSSAWKGIKSVGSKLISGAGSILGALPTKLAGGVVDLGTSWLQNKYIQQPAADAASDKAFQNSAYAFDRSREAYQNRYQDTYQDMLKAGLNPILAATGGFSVGNAPQMASASAFQANNTNIQGSRSYQSMQEGRHTEIRMRETLAKTHEVLKNIQVKDQQINESVQRVIKMRAEKGLITANEQKVVQEIHNLKKDWWIKCQQFNEVTQKAYLLNAQGNLTSQQIDKIKSEKKLIDVQSKSLKAKLAMLKRIATVYNGPSGQMLANVKAVMDALNLNFAAIVGGLK